jgi:hypothetical protein
MRSLEASLWPSKMAPFSGKGAIFLERTYIPGAERTRGLDLGTHWLRCTSKQEFPAAVTFGLADFANLSAPGDPPVFRGIDQRCSFPPGSSVLTGSEWLSATSESVALHR